MDFVYQYTMDYFGGINDGLFLDCGANVGTTSVYMKKKWGDSVRVISFEPIKQNYTLLKTNCVLNGYDDIMAENLGLSDQKTEMVMRLDPENMGRCCLQQNVMGSMAEVDRITETAQFVTLDGYVKEKNIDAKEIKCIWIDTEGHEDAVIAGAEETLRQSDAIVYMEYNPVVYRKNKAYAGLLEKLESIYHYFICWEQFSEGRTKPRPIKELAKLARETNMKQRNILLLKRDVMPKTLSNTGK